MWRLQVSARNATLTTASVRTSVVPTWRHKYQHIMHHRLLDASQTYDHFCVGFHGLDMATAPCVLLVLPLVELQRLMNIHADLLLAPISYHRYGIQMM